MVRKFVTLDGEILAEENWEPSRNDPSRGCFYCGTPAVWWGRSPHCAGSLDGRHDLIQLVNPTPL